MSTTSAARILIVIGDPGLDEPQHRALVRGRFTTVIRHAVELWGITEIVNPALPEGPNRWTQELGVVVPPSCEVRNYAMGQFEISRVRNSRLISAVLEQRALGARVVALYFKGPMLRCGSGDDLARKCESASIRVFDLQWRPENETPWITADDQPKSQPEPVRAAVGA